MEILRKRQEDNKERNESKRALQIEKKKIINK